MSIDTLMAAAQRLNTSVEALAALGAELRLRTEGLSADPRVRKLLQESVEGIESQLLDGTTREQQAAALAFIRAFFRMAMDLLDNPARPPGWSYDDPVVLQSLGQGSRRVVRAIEAFAAQRPDFHRAIEQPGTFLDIGTGVGWLAIEAARSWPKLKVVGIDIWEPALALARKNLADSSVADRVDIRVQGLEQLDDRDAFAVVWLAAPFIPAEVVIGALDRIYRATAPGGWFVFGLFAPPPSQLGEALTELRIVRSGGHPWTTDEVEGHLRAHGFRETEAFSPGPPVRFVVGKKPDTVSPSA